MGIGIIGCGHWGPNYIRNFMEFPGVSMVKCCDTENTRLDRIRRRFPGIVTCGRHEELLADRDIDAIIVSTPASTHYAIVKECLEAGKDVLAEKPLTLIPSQSLELHELSQKNKRILMVAHTFLYNTGIRKVKTLIDEGELGRIYYLNATRTHLGLIRDDVNVVWDLAPHDVSIFNYLLGAAPISVTAVGACHLKAGREDAAFINLVYPNDIVANIHVSWEDSNKERSIRVVGSKARVVFDDINNLERVKIYKKGIGVSEDYADFGAFQLNLRDGDIISPKLNLTEPMEELCRHFLECVQTRKEPLTDGRSGYEVVRVVNDAVEAMRKIRSSI